MTDQPNGEWTKIPNAILDAMPKMGDAELRVVLAILRKTAGWQKECDVISISQLERITGLSRPAVVTGIKAAMERGVLSREPAKRNGYCYRVVNVLNQSSELTSKATELELVNVLNQSDPQLVNVLNTQKKDSKERKERERVTRPPKQVNIDSLNEACQIVQEQIGKRLTPAAATRVADTITDLPRWTKVTARWAERYGSMNIDGMIDWYEHPERMEYRNGKQPVRTQSRDNSERKKQTETDLDTGF